MNKRRDALRVMMTPITPRAAGDEMPARSAVKSGSLKAMGLSLEGLSQDAGRARSLRDQLASGGHVVELDPAIIDPSIIRDRLDDWGTEEFADFQESIRSHGQQVPILVRPHPEKEDRYQVAYGHRRLEALRRLGLPVKAMVRELSDEALIVAQGKENSERRDLSFIERALFARRLEEHGFQRSALIAALSVHKGNLSTMITLARELPEDLILAIGPAPKVGRPRWEELSALVQDSAGRWRNACDQLALADLDSDQRFAHILRALSTRKRKPAREFVRGGDGTVFAQVEQHDRKLRVTIEERSAPDFGAYLLGQLPEIYAAFKRSVVSKPRNPPRKGA